MFQCQSPSHSPSSSRPFPVAVVNPCLDQSLNTAYLFIAYSYCASSDSLSAQFYEDLLCRGWRRSGTFLYRPNQRVSCCPHYTIRLDALAFRATKEQRQVINRFNRYVLGEDYIKESARIHPLSKQDAARRKSDFNLSERIHESENQKLNTPPKPAHNFEVTLETNSFTEEKYALFENYQRVVHHEPPDRITKSSFHSFLCSSPLKCRKQNVLGRDQLLGSYHQCYRLDGKLIAIGVLDLLPNAVSSVYFMYHESFHIWNPGKISALREAALAAEEGYRWYMMGFYIHSCVKMRYKAAYHPQYVLDPETHSWDLLDEDFKKRLDARKYVSLSREKKRENIRASSSAYATSIENPTDDTMDIDAERAESTSIENPTDDTIEMDAEHTAGGSSDDESFATEDISLFSCDMPGVLSPSELAPSLLDHIKLKIRRHIIETCDLVTWEASSIEDPRSIKGVIAELAAVVGTECAKNMTVSF